MSIVLFSSIAYCFGIFVGFGIAVVLKEHYFSKMLLRCASEQLLLERNRELYKITKTT